MTKPEKPPRLTRKEKSEALLADVGDELQLLSYHFKALAAKVRLASREIHAVENTDEL